ncbi:MAG: type I restriction endonuclease subunit R [Chloroflexi bacterium]|nr:type I restriction endonuclease subunit R [Chloroflexota bacterium]
MSQSDAFKELVNSQLPALQLLIQMGWTYLSQPEALELREGKERNVVLTGVLEPWLREHNRFTRKGTEYAFSDRSIQEALRKLLTEEKPSLLLTNASLYELLTLGTSLSETIDGDTFSPSLHYIDWKHPENNVYHVTDEFSVERRGSHEKRRPDIVLFVNGIPLVVIECKRADLDGQAELRDPSVVGEDEPAHLNKPIAEAISQMIRNQGEDQIPHLFAYSQLLMALQPNEAFYATTGTPKKFWSLWREEADLDPVIHDLINRPVAPNVASKLYNWRNSPHVYHQHFAALGKRLPTAQDRLIYALLRPERLLELAYRFIVFDGGVKKIARYQQYFAIKATIERVAQLNPQGTRTGGVIWHTTGSGKSLTMVMLAKGLALHPAISNPRVVLVTDRVDLDTQIYGTFHACGKSVVQANDGRHLVRLVTGTLRDGEKRGDVITTVINKFDQAARDHVLDEGHNVFVLVDESHRSQYGSMHAKMSQVFPNACYIGFTGTPLTKAEKSTAARFGSFIHKYPMRQAVVDQAVVPLLYEGRIVDQDVDKDQLEKWFERETAKLTDEQRTDLKRKMSRSEAVNATEQRLKEIAWNVRDHYIENHRGTGFKAMLACQSKRIGLKYLRYLTDAGIKAELVVSPPDTREGHEEIDDFNQPEIQAFWKKMMAQYGTEEAYNREIIEKFSQEDGIEILVVVDKLLTGFDEPRNTVLYLDKPLKEHTLLQAIARVNRLAEGKDFGYIIDYRGVLGELNEAMDIYDALAGFDTEDIEGTFADVSEEIRKLPQLHSDLWAIFQSVPNTKDTEAMQRFLEPEDVRERFYEALTDYARALRVALSTTQFYIDTPEDRVNLYKNDLRFFHQLRQAVRLRYAEAIDYREYEDKVRKLMDAHVKATGTSIISKLVDIFDVEQFEAEVERLGTPTAKADTILNRMKRTITERMDEDPAFYRRFAELVEETIRAYKEGRLSELGYLDEAGKLLHQMQKGHDSAVPAILGGYKHASAYFGVLRQALSEQGIADDVAADIAIQVDKMIASKRVRDWTTNLDVQKRIQQEIDDLLYSAERSHGLKLDGGQLNVLIEQVMEVAKARDAMA